MQKERIKEQKIMKYRMENKNTFFKTQKLIFIERSIKWIKH